MRTKTIWQNSLLAGICLALTLFTTASGQSSAPTLPRGVRTSNTKRYLVHIKTKMTVPSTGFRQVRVWHALPTPTPWCRTERMPPTTALSYSPGTARFELERDRRSGHIYYEQNNNLNPGNNLEFTTNFEFFSANRTFDTATVASNWSQYKAADYQGADAQVKLDPNFARVADGLKQYSDPVSYVKAACEWLDKNMTYDDTVPFAADDVASIWKYKRGHCGHFSNALKQLCQRAGVPFRAVWGLALDDAASLASMHKTTDTYTYCHTWAEVYIPYSGWIEVDPLHYGDWFSQPAKLVQNNTSFQNCSVWVTEPNKPSHMPSWSKDTGRWDYGTTTRVSFEER